MKWQLHEWLRELGLFACVNDIEVVKKDGKKQLVLSMAISGFNVGEVEVNMYENGHYVQTFTLEYIMEALKNHSESPDWLDLYSDDWEISDSSWNTICNNMKELECSFALMQAERVSADHEDD